MCMTTSEKIWPKCDINSNKTSTAHKPYQETVTERQKSYHWRSLWSKWNAWTWWARCKESRSHWQWWWHRLRSWARRPVHQCTFIAKLITFHPSRPHQPSTITAFIPPPTHHITMSMPRTPTTDICTHIIDNFLTMISLIFLKKHSTNISLNGVLY